MQLNKRIIVVLILTIIFGLLKTKQIYNQRSFFKNINQNQVNTIRFPAKVTKVMDGDTIEIEFLDKKPIEFKNKEIVRLIGIDCPELNLYKHKEPDFYAKEAYLFTKKELTNQYVELQLDNISQDKDKYGRVLGYIWVETHLFNQILVERGFAKYYPNFRFNSDKMELFSKAEQYSKINYLGMWE